MATEKEIQRLIDTLDANGQLISVRRNRLSEHETQIRWLPEFPAYLEAAALMASLSDEFDAAGLAEDTRVILNVYYRRDEDDALRNINGATVYGVPSAFGQTASELQEYAGSYPDAVVEFMDIYL